MIPTCAIITLVICLFGLLCFGFYKIWKNAK
jgi:hypothetical protein